MKLYRSVAIWRRLSGEEGVRYSCFEDLRSGKFCVQSADFFHLPVNVEMVNRADKQFVELFLEIDPEERCTWYDTLRDAITAHEKEFSNS
jgi:hypothetical protein